MNNQQAINLLKGLEQSLDDYCELNDEGKTAFGMAITALELFGNSEQLPSVQPSSSCAHENDTISRTAALEAIDSVLIEDESCKVWFKLAVKNLPSEQLEITLESAIDYLHSIGWMQEHDRILTESAQPERKRGKWIDDGDPFMWKCGCCGYRVKRYNNTRYCPHCGAKMEGDDERSD